MALHVLVIKKVGVNQYKQGKGKKKSKNEVLTVLQKEAKLL